MSAARLHLVLTACDAQPAVVEVPKKARPGTTKKSGEADGGAAEASVKDGKAETSVKAGKAVTSVKAGKAETSVRAGTAANAAKPANGAKQ